jgi:hypothetical protein
MRKMSHREKSATLFSVVFSIFMLMGCRVDIGGAINARSAVIM